MLKQIKDMSEDEINEEHKDLHRFLFITCVLSANIVEFNGLNFQEATERFKLLSQHSLSQHCYNNIKNILNNN